MSSNNSEFLWYIPNRTNPGHRGDAAVESHNSLDTLTSHAKALEDHGWKGALIAFLRASIRAGRLVNENPSFAAQFFKRTTGYHDVHQIENLITGVNLVPQLSERNLAALDVQKKFLLDHGYIKNDVDVRTWADDRYLQEALRSL